MATSPPVDDPSPIAMGCARVVAPLVLAFIWLTERPALLAIVAGLITVQGFFWHSGNVALFAPLLGLTMLWLLVRKSGRYRHGLLFALAYFLPISHWLGVFVKQWTGSDGLLLLAWGFVALGLSLPFAAIVPISARLLKANRVWVIPFVWVALELFRSYVPVLAFPWGLIAHPLAYDMPGLVLGRIGEYGAGGIVVAFSLVLFAPVQKRIDPTFETPVRRMGREWSGAIVGGFLAVLIIGEFLPGSGPNLRLAAYGPGLDLAYGPYANEGVERRLALLDRIADARQTQERLDADLIVLPEGLISSHSSLDLPGLQGQGTLLLGGQRHAEQDGKRVAYQTAFAFDGATGKWESADKTRLVIFGEFVPGRGVIPYPPSFALPGGDLAAASELRTIDVHARDGRPFRVGPILCFEALFPDIAYRQKLRGADVLAVMSLDDWFGGTMAPEWLELASRWRAAETGLPLVRVGSLGKTSLIDSRGRVQRSLPWGHVGTIVWNPAKP